jgi:calpain-15
LNEENLDFNKLYEDLGKSRYVDSSFPATISSLTDNVKRFSKAKTIKWKSASEIFEECKVFEGKVEPGDIKQGGLGDCYFLSSLSVLAERENLIKRLFVTKEVNSLGCYSVWLCKDSEWV